MTIKSSTAYSVWTSRIQECLRNALTSADLVSNREWVTNAVKGEYAHLVAAGTSVACPTTNGHRAFRIAASTMDGTGAVVFIAYRQDAVVNQLPQLLPFMFADDAEHRHHEAWL